MDIVDCQQRTTYMSYCNVRLLSMIAAKLSVCFEDTLSSQWLETYPPDILFPQLLKVVPFCNETKLLKMMCSIFIELVFETECLNIMIDINW